MPVTRQKIVILKDVPTDSPGPQLRKIGPDREPDFMLEGVRSRHSNNFLSDREYQVLVGIAMGYTNYQIGKALYVSIDTVKTHVRKLLKRMGARNRCHAVAIGFRMGILH